MLFQVQYLGIPGLLTVLVDAHVLLFSQDGIVGLQAVLLQHSLIAVACQSLFGYEVKSRGMRTQSLPGVARLVNVLLYRDQCQTHTKDVQERVLQAEELVSVGSHCEGVLVERSVRS